MTVALYVEIDVIGMILLLAIFICHRRNDLKSTTDKVFKAMGITLFLILASDAALYLIDGSKFTSAATHNLILNSIQFLLLTTLAYMGWLYIVCFVQLSARAIRSHIAPYALPMALSILLLGVNVPTGILFTIDPNNVYHRGPAFMLVMLIPALYVVAALVVAARAAKLTSDPQKRRRYRFVAGFITIPVIAFAVQSLSPYGLSIGNISIVLSLTVIFMNSQTTQVSTDMLTGVNNRGRLQQYLYSIIKDIKSGDAPLFALLVDVDDFKKINDTFGHAIGDAALIQSAVILKSACVGSGDFLARYGGDEFVIICRRRNEMTVQAMIDGIHKAVAMSNERGEHGYQLSFSIGYARYRMGMDAMTFLSIADSQMYRIKSAKKKRRKNP